MGVIPTKLIRTYFTGKASKYVFERCKAPDNQALNKTNLYIHIPFCRNMCPYCPYNKIEYDEMLVKPYLDSVLKEIRLYKERFGRFEISSIYIGGGTPTLLIDELGVILREFKDSFSLKGDICIETSPNDISDVVIAKLKEQGVGLVSCGVQSFQDANLRFIGRKYKETELGPKLKALMGAGFKSVNIDLMFALPGQGIDNLKYDLERAIGSGVNQVTTYPLFTFPYTAIGKYLRLKNVKMPDIMERRKLYYFIHEYFKEKDFDRVSVWGFKKGSMPRYSSVTRDNYIGLGAGAGSHLPDGFYLNTFSVEEYINRCSSGEFPTALHMRFNKQMQDYFWLYWRLYDTRISKECLSRVFQGKDRKLTGLFNLTNLLGLTIEDGNDIKLSLKGAFWIHLMQNYFSLNYINKVWTVAMSQPFPESIVL